MPDPVPRDGSDRDVPPGNEIRIRGASFTGVAQAYVCSAGIATTLLVLAGTARGGFSLFLFVYGAIFAVLFVAAVIFHSRPVVISNTSVRIPKLIGQEHLPLAAIAGVGLVYYFSLRVNARLPKPAGEWRLSVWDSAGREYKLFRFSIRTGQPRGMNRYTAGDFHGRLPHEEYSYLANCRAGRVALAIYQAATRVQRGLGPLALLALEKHRVYDMDSRYEVALAWWSPDGTMGRTQVAGETSATVASEISPTVRPILRAEQLQTSASDDLTLVSRDNPELSDGGFLVSRAVNMRNRHGRSLIAALAIVFLVASVLAIFFS